MSNSRKTMGFQASAGSEADKMQALAVSGPNAAHTSVMPDLNWGAIEGKLRGSAPGFTTYQSVDHWAASLDAKKT